MAAVPGIRSPDCLPFNICIIFGKSPFAVGKGVVGGMKTWHNWRSISLVAVVLGIRPPKHTIFLGGVGG